MKSQHFCVCVAVVFKSVCPSTFIKGVHPRKGENPSQRGWTQLRPQMYIYRGNTLLQTLARQYRDNEVQMGNAHFWNSVLEQVQQNTKNHPIKLRIKAKRLLWSKSITTWSTFGITEGDSSLYFLSWDVQESPDGFFYWAFHPYLT
jgi:hypothetical protein